MLAVCSCDCYEHGLLPVPGGAAKQLCLLRSTGITRIIVCCGSAAHTCWLTSCSPALASLQVKVQTVPGFARGLTDGLPKVIAQEGFAGCVPFSSFIHAQQVHVVLCVLYTGDS